MKTSRYLIKGGRVIDPATGIDGFMDILIEDGTIVKIEKSKAQSPKPNDTDQNLQPEVIDASEKIVTPGLIDMHVHLREPGHEYKEIIKTGCLAAAHGGFTTICCMPNTDPVNDNQSVTDYILKKAKLAGTARVYPVGAISRGLRGKSLAEYGELKAAGVVAVSDDGNPVMNAQLMRRALEYAKGFGLLVIAHCEDRNLTANGVMNEGVAATRLGLAGIPNAAETVMVARDIALCELTGAPLHIAHVSAEGSVRLIRKAKAHGLPVTAETAPHYFSLTEEAVINYDTNAKVSPPLRTAKDRDAIREALADGTIDVIASDHAPHSSIEKDLEFDQAANGMIGLETSLPLSLQLVEMGLMSLNDLVAKMSTNPARILNLGHRGLKPGNPADLTIIDPEKKFTVDPNTFKSRSRNTPFNGWELKGKAVLTMVGGKIVFDETRE
ncbi:MAG: dihydroorotase [Deltaproteobacteria bacterium]|nr:dihydroorotase [Deltaproteobacteria bacterium]MBW2074128.1 dihydroorotase [Deltaproteobacteria bacterium]